MGEAGREPMPHEVQVGNCDGSGFRTNHGSGCMPRHVRDLRSAVPPEPAATTAQIFISDDEELPLLPARRGSEEDSSDSEEDVDRPMPRRSGRAKLFPDRYGL